MADAPVAARFGVRRGRPLAGRFAPPGDKSISHRALLFGLLADGETRIHGLNPGADCARTAAAVAALGARVEAVGGAVRVHGTAGALRAPQAALDCGNSGTSLRLLAGIVAARPFTTTLTGDASLSRRPMRRIAEPLERMGARLEGRGGACLPPLVVRGGALTGIAYASPVASAQVSTCVLLAGLAAAGTTSVALPGPARDHTERMLPGFGVRLEVEPLPGGGRRTTLAGGQTPRGAEVTVPGDFSGAAFALAAAAATPGATVTATGVDLNPTRTGLLDVLAAMGAGVAIAPAGEAAGEPFGDVTVTGPEALAPFDVPAAWLPRLLDEVPAWTVAASAARGASRLTGAAELRVKESDRLAALAEGLVALGLGVRELPDGLEVTGGVPRGGVRVRTHLDHRIAMAFAALGSRAAEPVWFDDVASVDTSYPGYFGTLAALGAGLVPDPGADGGAA